jgi:hypothetical protein
MAKLVAQNQKTTRRNLFLTGELVKLLDCFASEGVDVIPFKGPVLALLAYGDLGLRQFGDLDIVIRKQDFSRVKGLLINRGFKPKPALNSAQEAALLRFDCAYNFENQQGVILDVHWGFIERHFSIAMDVNRLWDQLQPITIGDRRFMTLAPEDLILILCLHGFTHLWERLGWISDIAGLIDVRKDLDWQAVLQNANKLGLRRILLLGLLLAADLLDAQVPAEIRQAAREDSVVEGVAHQVQEQLFIDRDAPRGLVRGAILDLRMRERHRDRIRSCLRLILTPRSYDWMSVSLPESLFFLYYLVRPVRLARKYGLQLLWGSKDRRTPTGGNGLSNS